VGLPKTGQGIARFTVLLRGCNVPSMLKRSSVREPNHAIEADARARQNHLDNRERAPLNMRVGRASRECRGVQWSNLRDESGKHVLEALQT
jgi:hypothetical protein